MIFALLFITEKLHLWPIMRTVLKVKYVHYNTIVELYYYERM